MQLKTLPQVLYINYFLAIALLSDINSLFTYNEDIDLSEIVWKYLDTLPR